MRAKATAARHEPSLAPFLPRRGEGLALSASDIETYRACPLKYKFARVFRVPQEPTINQRFGIVVHQVLERYHQSGGQSVDELLGLLEAGWRRSGFGPTDEERQLHVKAENALQQYHERFQADDAEPMWFEKSFNFKIGAHTLRGRVDRVDRMADGRYELIDYKTGRPKAPAQLRDDVQLALYAVAATAGLEPRLLGPVLLVRVGRPEGPAARRRQRRRVDRRDRPRGRRRHPRPGLRADAVICGLLDLRLPHRLPGGGALALAEEAVSRPSRRKAKRASAPTAIQGPGPAAACVVCGRRGRGRVERYGRGRPGRATGRGSGG